MGNQGFGGRHWIGETSNWGVGRKVSNYWLNLIKDSIGGRRLGPPIFQDYFLKTFLGGGKEKRGQLKEEALRRKVKPFGRVLV